MAEVPSDGVSVFNQSDGEVCIWCGILQDFVKTVKRNTNISLENTSFDFSVPSMAFGWLCTFNYSYSLPSLA